MSKENDSPAEATSSAPDKLATERYEKCPHCGNSTLIEPSKALVFRCGVCGKARVPVELSGFKRSEEEIPLLARASASHTASLAWSAGSAVLGGFSLISLAALGLVLSALNPGMVPLLFGLLIALLPGGLAAYGVRRAAQLKTQVAPALEEGWLRVAREVVDAEGAVTDAQLAKILHVDRERAEQLLTQLSATSAIRHRLEDPAPLSFESPKLRVEVPSTKEVQKEAPSTKEEVQKKDTDRDEQDLAALEASEEQAARKASEGSSS